MDKTADGSEALRFRPNRTFICSVVFLDIVEYSKKPVEEQIRLKEHFNALLSEAIKDIAVTDRIILDTGDGAAIGFLGDPEDALFVAMSFQEAIASQSPDIDPQLTVRFGINLGPVKVLKDINKQLNLIGDGINVAQRIMSFAEPGQLLVSRSFYDIVSVLSQDYAKLFQYQGARADKHVREHDIYAVEHTGARPVPAHQRQEKKREIPLIVDIEATDSEKLSKKEASVVSGKPAAKAAPERKGKRWLYIGGPILAVIIIGLAVFIPRGKAPEEGRKEAAQVVKTTKPAKSSRTPAAATAPAVSDSEAKAARASSETKPIKTRSETKSAAAPSETRPASVRGVSSSADDIVFTLTGVKSSSNEITFTVMTYNKSTVAKSVALYDDAFRWPKSKITDDSGITHDVNKVNFVKGSQTIAMSAAGTQGVPIGPNESVTTYMTFKKAGKGVKALHIHPFIYQGRSWKEHDLAMKLGR